MASSRDSAAVAAADDRPHRRPVAGEEVKDEDGAQDPPHEQPPSDESAKGKKLSPPETVPPAADETSLSSARTTGEPDPERDEENREATPAAELDPPLPKGQPPSSSANDSGAPAKQQPEDDGWDFQWDPTNQAYFFYNRFTGQTTWENPRIGAAAEGEESESAAAVSVVPGTEDPTSTGAATALPPPLPPPPLTVAGGYNPAIHGNYDPNAWYARGSSGGGGAGDGEGNSSVWNASTAAAAAALAAGVDPLYVSGAHFNRSTGRVHHGGGGAADRPPANAFFDVDAAANSHDGKSLKAERQGRRLTKGELKAFKEKRKAKKEEKRRAWLRD